MTIAKCMAAVAVAMALSASVPAQAQMNMGSDKSMKAGGKANPAEVYDKLLTMQEKEIVGLAEAMPADKYDFAPSQAIFQSSQKVEFSAPKPVSTFGQQLAHVASANYYFFGVGGEKPSVDPDAIEKLTKKDEIVKALKDSFAYAHKAVAGFTGDNVFALETYGKGQATRGGMATFGLGHMMDHYGQLVVYLRTNGMVPPASRK
jgi:uncharacterized damage-inducible protein DinB